VVISNASSSMFWLNRAIQGRGRPLAPSGPQVGKRGATVKRTPMLSRPRKPPSNTFLAEAGPCGFTHQVKFSKSLLNVRLEKIQVRLAAQSLFGFCARRVSQMRGTGGFYVAVKFHSYAGIWPLGCK